MNRILVEGHKFNDSRQCTKWRTGEEVYFLRGVIKCNGKDKPFVVWGKDLLEAKERFKGFLKPECICVFCPRRQIPCPVHMMNVDEDLWETS